MDKYIIDPYIIYGAYAFTTASFIFTVGVYKYIRADIKEIWAQITNHQNHRFEDIEKRLNKLEDD